MRETGIIRTIAYRSCAFYSILETINYKQICYKVNIPYIIYLCKLSTYTLKIASVQFYIDYKRDRFSKKEYFKNKLGIQNTLFAKNACLLDRIFFIIMAPYTIFRI